MTRNRVIEIPFAIAEVQREPRVRCNSYSVYCHVGGEVMQLPCGEEKEERCMRVLTSYESYVILLMLRRSSLKTVYINLLPRKKQRKNIIHKSASYFLHFMNAS